MTHRRADTKLFNSRIHDSFLEPNLICIQHPTYNGIPMSTADREFGNAKMAFKKYHYREDGPKFGMHQGNKQNMAAAGVRKDGFVYYDRTKVGGGDLTKHLEDIYGKQQVIGGSHEEAALRSRAEEGGHKTKTLGDEMLNFRSRVSAAGKKKTVTGSDLLASDGKVIYFFSPASQHLTQSGPPSVFVEIWDAARQVRKGGKWLPNLLQIHLENLDTGESNGTSAATHLTRVLIPLDQEMEKCANIYISARMSPWKKNNDNEAQHSTLEKDYKERI